LRDFLSVHQQLEKKRKKEKEREMICRRKRERIEVYHERSFTVARTAQGKTVGVIAVREPGGGESVNGERQRSKSSRRYHSLCGSRALRRS